MRTTTQGSNRCCATAWLLAAVLAVASGLAARPAAGEEPIVPVPAKAKAKADKPDKTAPKADRADKVAPKPDADKDKADKPAEPAPASLTPVGEDALRLGPFVPPPKAFPFPLLGDDRAREIFVDRAGQLYRERPYSGHVPDWNAAPPVSAGGRCKVEAQQLTWVGFQNNADGSRVFVQLERDACGYVYRPDDTHIVVDLPAVTVANANLKHDILTGAFPTSVELVHVEEVPGRGTRVVIVLKDRRPYLSAHLGQYVFVDIAR